MVTRLQSNLQIDVRSREFPRGASKDSNCPVADTPIHREYPCAHRIVSGANAPCLLAEREQRIAIWRRKSSVFSASRGRSSSPAVSHGSADAKLV
jgi:hypothetical protein